MNIFLTGGTGLVGTAISKMLTSNFNNIDAIYRNHTIKDTNFNWVKFDIATYNEKELQKLLNKKDIIIHNAASIKIGNTLEERNEIDKTNIKFTKYLLEIGVEQGVKKFIFTSTLSAIQKPLPQLITEEALLQCTSYYSESKLICEQLIQEYAKKYNLQYGILRISSPINLDINLLPQTVLKHWIEQSKSKKNIQVFGNGSRTQDFVAVSDIANAFLNCINKDNLKGIYNVASGNTISMLALAQLITKKFNNNIELIGTDVNENDRWNISIEKARKELNYQPKFTSKEIIVELLKNIAI